VRLDGGALHPESLRHVLHAVVAARAPGAAGRGGLVILSDRDVRFALKLGHLEIEPYDPACLQPSSYDCHLGTQLLSFPKNWTDIDPQAPPPMRAWTTEAVFRLQPQEIVLYELAERLRLPADMVARVEGKALALDTEVPTPTGWTTLGAIQPGDYVLGMDGLPTVVVAATEVMERRPCYEVVFDDRTTVIADAEHWWLTWDKPARQSHSRARTPRIHPTLRTTQEIAGTLTHGGHERNHAVDVVRVDLPAQLLPIDPYVLGYWLGDGTSTAAHITVAVGDQPHARAQFADAGLPLNATAVGNRATPVTFRFGRAEGDWRAAGVRQGTAQAVLRAMGVLGNKHIPIAYLRASTPQRLALLQGLMDADGSLNRDDQAELTLTNKRLADDAAELLASLGVKVWRDARAATLGGRDCGTAYRCRFRPTFPVFRLARKEGRVRYDVQQLSEVRRRFIRDVRMVDSVPVRCIQVAAPDGMFLVTRSFIPTHNSSLARLGLTVHLTAGYVDPGWDGVLTLELKNEHAACGILLRPGMRIAQLSFMRLSSPAERPYGSAGINSHYQGSTTVVGAARVV
jgi:deoxycytidine triphosphate deaminase